MFAGVSVNLESHEEKDDVGKRVLAEQWLMGKGEAPCTSLFPSIKLLPPELLSCNDVLIRAFTLSTKIILSSSPKCD